ncbi:SF1B family DNA helicase RecD2 [Alkaliphilus serpentinus]|uniref:ATP-dependent RecD2 DNA helicase n=1 Tax=Alkaliphilus serpentinus TaxID=1482731 RepID=A0A833HLT6_9FIRM|nr:ATP-dependent RecD-like DNA helicase [Alkaliphilus serpentinus]KAB3526652.1 ATP-dependent RecD-like DNA helicase [Alkaliphilus serpentinus]
MVELEGKLIEIIYKNDTNGYLVGLLSTPEEDVTIVGCLPTLKEGEGLSVKGNWILHPTYGRQLEVKEFKPVHPSSIEGIINYLSSGIVKGIGEKMAKRVVEHFGIDTLEIMQYNPHKLMEVSGIGEAKAEAIAHAFHEERELREIVFFLSKYGVSPVYAVKIYKRYTEATLKVIHENPYRLAEDVIGIGFRKADEIAKSMGVPEDSGYRIQAAARYTMNGLHGEGHTYAPLKLLIRKTHELTGCNHQLVEESIQNLMLDQKLHLEKHEDEFIVYSMAYYYAESNVCKALVALAQRSLEPIATDINKVLEDLHKEEKIQLADRQKEAVIQATENAIMIITGGPGTGKTTIIKALIKILERNDKKLLLAAPTGRAAKRMTEATGREAKTIHRLLELGYSEDDENMVFQRNEENPLDADVIIIDEGSMVDILLMNNLLKAIDARTSLIFVGDVDQLPSVGAGNVLKDIIDSGIIKVVRLTEIFRQAQESMIIVNAHRINEGKEPLCNVKEKDFYFLSKRPGEDMVYKLLSLVKDRLPNHYNLESSRDIQVISPMKKGEAGTLNLNKALQNGLNPAEKDKKEKEFRGKLFRVGDKVMQIKNNYSLKWTNISPNSVEEKGEGVFNGDIGYITEINSEDNEMVILFDDSRLVIYDFSQLEELELAYCITVHKSQGSEFPVVVMPITWGPPMLLTRNLLYTAVTRAKSLVVLVGTESYLHQMIKNVRTIERYSGLGFRLKRYFDFHSIKQ